MDAELTCREFDAFLADYLSEELAPAARHSFDRHLALCSQCVDYLASYRDTIRLGRRAFEAERAAPVPEELIRAILAARRAADDESE